MKSFFVLGFLLIGLAGCSYTSDKPLISDDQAAFPFDPYAVITFTIDAAQDSQTLVRKGNDYLSVNPYDVLVQGRLRFMRVADGYYVVQLSSSRDDAGATWTYAAVKVDLSGKKILPFRLEPEKNETGHVDDLAAFVTLVRSDIAAMGERNPGDMVREVGWDILATLAVPGSLNSGLAAYQRGDHPMSLTILRPLAADGSADAQVALGVMYDAGKGVPQNDTNAVDLYRLAAEAGNAQAQNNLGVMYEKGRGVTQDYAEAAKWYLRAAEQRNAQARKNLRDLGALGLPANAPHPEDLTLSGENRWVAVASRQDLDGAISIAAVYFEQRSRVVRARNGWFAVVLGPYATPDITSFRQSYKGPELPPDAILTGGSGYVETVWLASPQDAEGHSVDWAACEKPENADASIAACTAIINGSAANKTHPYAYGNRGVAHLNEGDYDQAIADFDEAIELKPDYAGAFYNRGKAFWANGARAEAFADYDKAIQLKPDYADAYIDRGIAHALEGDATKALADFRAVEPLLTASDQRLRVAESWITVLTDQPRKNGEQQRQEANPPPKTATLADGDAAYRRGDYATALKILTPLAEQGNAVAENRLGVMYTIGQGVPQDLAEALSWYRRAAEKGLAEARTNLGEMYEFGRGVQQDYAEAAKWYRLAAATDSRARERLRIVEERIASLVPQRAILYEEPLNTAAAAAGVVAMNAAVTWSYLPNGINGPEIVGNIEVPERGMKVKLAIRRITDNTLPANHIVEVVVDVPASFPGKGIRDAPRMVLKPSEAARGQPLIGVSAKVSDGLFWIALSGEHDDVASNLKLMKDRLWIDLPMVYETGQRAILTFEKGTPGERVFEQAMTAWAAAEPAPIAEESSETQSEKAESALRTLVDAQSDLDAAENALVMAEQVARAAAAIAADWAVDDAVSAEDEAAARDTANAALITLAARKADVERFKQLVEVARADYEIVSGGTSAQPDWAACQNQAAPGDARIRACLEIIALGAAEGRELALAFLNRGEALLQQGDLTGAIADFDKAIQLKSDFADAYYKRALTYEQEGDPALALIDFRVAARLIPAGDPRHAEALARIAELEKTLAAKPPVTPAPSPIPQQPSPPKVFTGGGIVVKVSQLRIGDEEVNWVTVEGDLKPGDEKFFKQALLTVENPVVFVSLKSDGGDLRAGMEIGRTIWTNQSMTVVEEGICASACALAWLAGRPRYATPDAEIGFHAPTRADDSDRRSDSGGSALVGGYLAELGFTEEAIVYMTESGPDEMNWLTSDKARDLGIYVEDWK